MMWYGPAGWFGWLMPLVLLVFTTAVVTLVVLAARYLLREPRPHTLTDGPERILAERFARGEISAEEYRDRLRTLHDPTRH